MSDFVRVRLPNGHEATLPAEYVAAHARTLEVLDAPATNLRGTPLRASRKGGRRLKPVTTVNKEAAKKAVSRKSAIPAPSDEPTTGGVAVAPEEALAP